MFNIFQLFKVGIHCNAVFGVQKEADFSTAVGIIEGMWSRGASLFPHSSIHPHGGGTPSTYDANTPRKQKLGVRQGLKNLSVRGFKN